MFQPSAELVEIKNRELIFMTDRRRTDPAPTRAQTASAVLAGQAAALGRAGDRLLTQAPVAGRIVAKRIPGLPGLVYDIGSIAGAEDKRRATAEAAGGFLGAGLGGAVGGPLGAAAGSLVGQKAAELYMDHEKDIHAWMDDRWRDVARAAGEQVLPYTPIPRMNRAIAR